MSDQERVTLILVAAPDDSAVADPEYQRGLRAVSGALRDAGILSAQRRMTFDADGAAIRNICNIAMADVVPVYNHYHATANGFHPVAIRNKQTCIFT